MVNKSPLRYPGGKTRAIKILESYIVKYYPNDRVLVSPFLGGGSFELYLADKGYQIHANDLFKPLYTFWSNANKISENVRSYMPVSKETFHKMRKEIEEISDPIEIATYYFIINRCSFSGSTFCGGYSQQAATGRLTESSIKTLENVDLSNVKIYNEDCVTFLKRYSDELIYADPPYYIETYIYGKDGDLHEAFDHEAFAIELKKHPKWILSYNDCPYIRNLYKDCRIFSESWSYGMNSTKKSSEILILPPE